MLLSIIISITSPYGRITKRTRDQIVRMRECPRGNWVQSSNRRASMSTSMETESEGAEDPPGRWRDIQKLLTRGSPLAHPDFEPSDQVQCSAVRVGALIRVRVCI